MTALTIGRLAEAAGVPLETIRYYERRGLLPVPPRTAAGYRLYSAVEVRRLELIRRAKGLGFTLAEIAGLLGEGADESEDDEVAGPTGTSDVVDVAGAIRRAAVAKLAAVDDELLALVEVRDRLRRLVATCDQGDDEGCAALAPGGSGA